MRRLGAARASELAEMIRFQELPEQHVRFRLLLWTGVAGAEFPQPATYLEGRTNLGTGDFCSYRDLGRHYWLLSIGAEFAAPPGVWRVDYCCDLEGLFASADVIPEADWIALAAGETNSLNRIGEKGRLWETEAESRDHVTMCPLFARFVRVVTPNPASVIVWHVAPDSSIDFTDKVTADGFDLAKSVDSKNLNQYVPPTLRFSLEDSDGRLEPDGDAADPWYDGDGESRVGRYYARWTLETAFLGEHFEIPSGFENSGWWPVFEGFVRSRVWSEEALDGGGRRTVLELSLRAGIRALDEVVTLPLLEQQTVGSYLRNWVSRDTEPPYPRLLGVARGMDAPPATAFDEFVGNTFAFGSSWRDRLFSVDAPERVHALCTAGSHLIALTCDNVSTDVRENRWWLVRYSLNGAELERVVVHEQFPATRPFGPEMGLYDCSDLALFGDELLVTISKLRLSNYGGTEFHSSPWTSITKFPVDTWINGNSGQGQLPYTADLVGAICALGSLYYAVAYHASGADDATWVLDIYDGNGALRGRFEQSGGYVPRRAECYAMGNDTYLVMFNGVMDYVNAVDPSDRNVLCKKLTVTGGVFLCENFDGRRSDVPLSGLCVYGDFVLAAGISSGGQEVAKVARMGWPLENGAILRASTPPVNGGGVPLNYADPEIVLSGDVLSADRYVLDTALGHVSLLFLPDDGLPLRASYDYVPTFGLVRVVDAERLAVASEAAAGFDLRLRMDEAGRLAAFPRRWDEAVVMTTGRTWILGSTGGPDGEPWIIAESIEIVSRGGTAAIDSSLYTLVSEDWVLADGLACKRWTLTAGTLGERALWLVRFRAQQVVPRISRAVYQSRVSREADVGRLVTSCKVKSSRRLPADFPQWIKKEFAVAPYAEGEILGGFRNLKPVEGTAVYDWNPAEKLFDKSPDDATASFLIPFEAPLLLGSSRWSVVCGDPGKLWYSGSLAVAAFNGKRFLKVVLGTTPPDADYFVWNSLPDSYRIAVEADRSDMFGNTYPENPADGVPLKTTAFFYVKKKNSLFDDAVKVLAYHSRIVKYSKNAAGSVVIDDGSDEAWVPTVYRDRAVEITLTGHDLADGGAPLFVDVPAAGFDAARMVVDRVEIDPDGLSLYVKNFGPNQAFLSVEVTGYPVLDVETFYGVAENAAAREKYGKKPRTIENSYCPNEAAAERLAGAIVERRSGGGERFAITGPLALLMEEDSVCFVEDRRGVFEERRIGSVKHSIRAEGSETEMEVGTP